jgi:hypothetical protein
MTNDSRKSVTLLDDAAPSHRSSSVCCNFPKLFWSPFSKRRDAVHSSEFSKLNFSVDAELGHAFYLPEKLRDKNLTTLDISEDQSQGTSEGSGERCDVLADIAHMTLIRFQEVLTAKINSLNTPSYLHRRAKTLRLQLPAALSIQFPHTRMSMTSRRLRFVGSALVSCNSRH